MSWIIVHYKSKGQGGCADRSPHKVVACGLRNALVACAGLDLVSIRLGN